MLTSSRQDMNSAHRITLQKTLTRHGFDCPTAWRYFVLISLEAGLFICHGLRRRAQQTLILLKSTWHRWGTLVLVQSVRSGHTILCDSILHISTTRLFTTNIVFLTRCIIFESSHFVSIICINTHAGSRRGLVSTHSRLLRRFCIACHGISTKATGSQSIISRVSLTIFIH